jgi:flagellar protein FliL
LSNDPLESEEAPDEELPTPKAGPSLMVLLVLALVGAGAGGWFGGPVLTPMVAQVAASRGEDDGGGGHGAPSEGAEGPVTIENLVLNPAGSGASRFLIATLVLDAEESVREDLAFRDAEARDLLLTILSSRTVEQLSDIALRDVIREDLRSALNTMLGYEGVHRIFLPQFVIQ